MMDIDEWNEEILAGLHSSKTKTKVLIARCAGTLGLLGSIYIIQDILKDTRRRKPTKNRIILFMSICDFLFSISSPILGPLLGPKEIGAPGSIGNVTTCTIQGFMVLSSATTSAYYNVTLALCYLLIVRYEYSDDRLRKLEPYFIYIPIGMGLLIAIPGLPLHIYNFNESVCYISAKPYGCNSDGSPVECETGDYYNFLYIFNSIEIFIAACFIIGCMIMMYSATLQRERSGNRFRFSTSIVSTTRGELNNAAALGQPPTSSPSSSPVRIRRNLSDVMRAQGLWYSGAFLISFSPIMLSAFIDTNWLGAVMTVTIDMLGFTNAVIYIRPRFLTFRRDYPNIGIASSLWHTLVRSNLPTTTRRQSEAISMSSPLVRGSWTAYKDRMASGMRSLKGWVFTGGSSEEENNNTGEIAVIVNEVMEIDVDKRSLVQDKDCNEQEEHYNSKDEGEDIGTDGWCGESKEDVGDEKL